MRTTFIIKPEQLGKFERKLAQNIRLEQVRALRIAGKRAVAYLTEKSSHIHDLMGFCTGWRVKSGFVNLEVYNAAPHAIFVEKGRRAGARPPPMDAIRPWVIRHFGTDAPTFAVARNIGIRGIAARPVMSAPETLEVLNQYALDAAQEAFHRAVLRSAP